jgi:hypothetical protein
MRTLTWITSKGNNLQQSLGRSLGGRSEAKEILAFVGGIAGFLVAGTIYGLMAAIYDSHRQIRRVTQIAGGFCDRRNHWIDELRLGARSGISRFAFGGMRMLGDAIC